jgi:hypothetical protein
MSHTVKPWRFIAAEDVPECGIVRGDMIVAFPGHTTRLYRNMPVNPGLLLNLLMQDQLVQIEGVIGDEALVLQAMEAVDRIQAPAEPSLKMLR